MNLADIKALFTAGSGVIAVFLTLVQISPVKVNPWSWLGKIIGRTLNAEVLEQQKQTQMKLSEHIRNDDKRNADTLRMRILHFNNELLREDLHTREEFIEILAVIDDYESYCRANPDYKNNRATHAIANIGRVYDERLEKRDFL